MGVLESFALGFRGGATSAATTKYTEQERLAVLEQITRLETGLSQAMSNNDKAALSYYESQVKAQQENRKLTAQLVRDAMRADGTMNVEALKARAADLRNIRDNTSRMLAAYGRRGLAEYQNAVNQFAGQLRAGASGTAGRTAVIEYLNSTLDPSDPATYEALRTAYSAFGMTVPPEGLKGAGAWASAQADLKTVGRFSEKPPENATEAQELKAALDNIGNTGTPSFEASRAAVGEGSVPEIRDRIAKLEGQLSSTAVQGLQPPTMAQLESAAGRSGYQKWAEARGFTIGTFGDNGKYEPGPDDQRAYWRAWREANGRMTFGRDKMGVEQTLVVMPAADDKGPYGNSATIRAASKYKMFPIANAEGALDSTLVETPAGDLYLVRGDGSTIIRNRDGEWSSPQAKIDHEGDLASLQTWNLDGKPLTLETVSGMFDPANQEKLAPMGDTEEPSAVTRVNGRKLNPHLSDDPNNTVRMAVPGDNGVVYEVKYTRENADMPWVEQERVESKRYAGTMRQALPDGSPIPEPVKRGTEKSISDSQENDIRREVIRMGKPNKIADEELPSEPNAVGMDAEKRAKSTRPGSPGSPPEKVELPDMPGAPSRGTGNAIQNAANDAANNEIVLPVEDLVAGQDPNAPVVPVAPKLGSAEAIKQGLAENPENTRMMQNVAPIMRTDENGKPVVVGFNRGTDETRNQLAIQQADEALALTMAARRKKQEEDAMAERGDRLALKPSAVNPATPSAEAGSTDVDSQKPQDKPGFWKSLVNRFRKSTSAPVPGSEPDAGKDMRKE